MKRAAAVALALASLAGCGPSGPACPLGEVACGNTCSFLVDDPYNCGACGVVCAAGGQCVNSQCVAPLPAADLTLYWRFIGQQGDVFGDYSTVNPGCWTASVDQVRITLSNPVGPQPPVVVDCVQSNGSPGVVLPTWVGLNSWRVEGLRTGLPVFSVTGSVNVPDPLGATMDLDLDAIYGDMNLFYDLPASAACFAGDTVQLALYDYDYVPSRLAYTTDYPGFTIPIPCAYPPAPPPNGPDNFIVIPSLAPSTGTGYYRFNYISVIRGGLAVYQICNPPGFSWSGPTLDVGYTLAVAAGTCPLLPP